MNFDKRTDALASEQINAVLCPLIDGAISAKAKAEYAAGRGSGVGEMAAKRIGAGYIGIECDRQLAFRFHKYAIEPRESSVSPGELQRHAEAGHWTENMTAGWLTMIGLTVLVRNPENPEKQIGWMAARDPESGQFRMAGEVDGVIVGTVPDVLADLIKPPCIWESKKATSKKWKTFVKDGVKGADPRYYGQLQTNMAYLGCKQTLFSILDLDTMKFHFELVPYDGERAQKLSDRSARIIDSKHPYEFVRLGRTEDDFVCRFCDYQHQCWHPTDNQTASIQGPFPLRGFNNPNEMEEVPFP